MPATECFLLLLAISLAGFINMPKEIFNLTDIKPNLTSTNSNLIDMKKTTRIIAVLAVALLSTQVYGQYLKLQGGLNLANMIIEDNDGKISDEFTNRAGFNAGLLAGIGLGPIGVEGGLLVSSRGYNIDVTDGNTTTTGNMNSLYLDIPIDLKLELGLGPIGIYGSFGPVISYGFGGKVTSKTTNNLTDEVLEDIDEKIKWGSSEEDHLKKMDVGIGLGGGVNLGKLSLGVKYIWGVSNIAPTTDNGYKINNRTLQVNLGIKLIG
jgi:hypothetical protein